jgi:hypothetical protein
VKQKGVVMQRKSNEAILDMVFSATATAPLLSLAVVLALRDVLRATAAGEEGSSGFSPGQIGGTQRGQVSCLPKRLMTPKLIPAHGRWLGMAPPCQPPLNPRPQNVLRALPLVLLLKKARSTKAASSRGSREKSTLPLWEGGSCSLTPERCSTPFSPFAPLPPVLFLISLLVVLQQKGSHLRSRRPMQHATKDWRQRQLASPFLVGFCAPTNTADKFVNYLAMPR